MRKPKIFTYVCAIALAFVCASGLASCEGDAETTEDSLDIYDTSEGVAATVNGVEIGEKAVTAYIENFRTSGGLEDDDDWGQWLVDSDYTVEDIRTQVIEYYISQQLLRQAAEENDVTFDSDEIDSQIESMRSYYESDEAWEEALQSAGMTEDSYRSLLELSALEEGLMEVVITTEDPSDEDILTYGEMYAQAYDGAKKSSHILFASDDEDTAQEVLDQINAEEIDFADAAEQYSTDTASASDGGNVGWDALTSFVDEYQSALDELEEGEVSGLITSSYGIHIIKCTEVFTAPDELTSTDQLPDEFIETITSYLEEVNKEEAFNEWYEEYEEAADIQINDMPDGLSYNIDLTSYTTTDDTDDTSTGDSTDDVEEETSADDSDTTEEDASTDDATSEDSTEEESTESSDDSSTTGEDTTE